MTISASQPLERLFGGKPYVIRDIALSDAPEVLRLFAHAFGQHADEAWFNWKYRYGSGCAIGLWDQLGQLKAHCAGIPRTILWHGKHVAGLQIGDVMVSTDIRGMGMRNSPFQQVSSRFYSTYVGSQQSYQVAWGFPNHRHMRLGVTLDLFWDAGIISQLNWTTQKQQSRPWLSFVKLSEHAPNFDSEVNMVWQAMSIDMQDYVLGVRDSTYVRWRFLSRPDRSYQLFALRCRFTGRMQALVVMRIAEHKSEVLDVIGPRSTILPAIRAAINQAAAAGATTLTAWASSTTAEHFRCTGASAEPSGASLAIIKKSTCFAEGIMNVPWWWMGGDTDFL